MAFILFEYFPFGGLQNDCLAIARLSVEKGHEVTILSRSWKGQNQQFVRTMTLGSKGMDNIARNVNFHQSLKPILSNGDFDITVGFNRIPGLDFYYAADACYEARTRRMKGAWFRWTRRYRHYRQWEEAIFRKGAQTHVLLITAHEVEAYQEIYGTESHRLHVLPPGIKKQEFSLSRKTEAKAAISDELGLKSGTLLLVFVGRGFRTKGLDRAIRGLAGLPESLRSKARLAVLGEAPPGRFFRLARRLGVESQVIFLGGRRDVFDFMLAGNVLVHPAYSENTGTVLLEALTAGLPVLTTDTCGFATHIEKAHAGYVISSPFNQDAFTGKLRHILENGNQADWSYNALKYTASQDLYHRDEQAVDLLEKINPSVQSPSCT